MYVCLSLNSSYIIQRLGNVLVLSLQKDYYIKIKSWKEILSFCWNRSTSKGNFKMRSGSCCYTNLFWLMGVIFFLPHQELLGFGNSPFFILFSPTEVPQRISKETNKRVNDIFQSILKEISPKYPLERLMLKPKLPNTLTPWFEKLTHWKRPWCWERLKVGGEGDDRGWDGWMASLIQRTWVWANSGR